MPTIVTKTIGTGRDYATLSAFLDWINTQNLVTNDQFIDAVVYNDLSLGASAKVISLNNTDLTRYCRIRPADGLGYHDLNPTIGSYPSSGIQITFTANSTYFSLQSGAGLVWEGLRIKTYGTTISPFTFRNASGGKSPGTYLAGARRCVFANETGSAALITGVGAGGPNGSDIFFEDCLIVDDRVAANVNAISVIDFTKIKRCSVLSVVDGLYAMTVRTAAGIEGVVVQDTAIAGNLYINYANRGATAAAIANTMNNFVGGSISVNNPSSYTTYNASDFTAGVSGMFESGVSARPAASSPLLGAASANAVGLLDINLGNRGTSPDIGAIQRNPVSPMSGATITNTTVSGQTVTISGTTTNTPTSATATLAASSGGAVSQSGVAVTLGAGTFTVTFTALSPGVYSPISLSLTNAGGTSVVNGATGVTILEISGTPQTPGEGTGGGAVSGLYSGEVAVTRIYAGTTEITGLAVGSAVIF